jgi:hypothetical protein
MIKSGTRVSNKAGTGGFEFTRDVHYNEAWTYYSVLKPYGNSRMWGKKRVPIWLVDEIEKLLAASEPQQPIDYPIEHMIPIVYRNDLPNKSYSVEQDDGDYHVQLATLSNGEYIMRNILTTRSLWFAKLYARLHAVLA